MILDVIGALAIVVAFFAAIHILSKVGDDDR